MLGSLRLLLALLVALSHAGVRFYGYNPGVTAVVMFYLISGYVMTGLLRKHYTGWKDIPAFYLDRVLRLYPQYLFFAALTLAWAMLTDSRTGFLRYAPGAADIINNLTVIPLNFFMFNQTDHYTLIPPAWSLGAEMQFYLLMPLLLLLRLRATALLGSFAVYALAAWGTIHTEWFGYRLLPGVLFMFLLGSWLYECRRARGARRCVAAGIAWLALGGVLLVLGAYGRLNAPYNVETLVGLLIGLPLLHFLGRMSRRGWDEFLGDLSYGVFLCHFLILWLAGEANVHGARLVPYLLATLALSFLSQRLVERSILRLRHKLRKKPA